MLGLDSDATGLDICTLPRCDSWNLSLRMSSCSTHNVKRTWCLRFQQHYVPRWMLPRSRQAMYNSECTYPSLQPLRPSCIRCSQSRDRRSCLAHLRSLSSKWQKPQMYSACCCTASIPFLNPSLKTSTSSVLPCEPLTNMIWKYCYLRMACEMGFKRKQRWL